MHTNVEWDPEKAAANLEKHGIDFASAAIALDERTVRIISARKATKREREQYAGKR
jgi:uncharacterized DUF497 family protein